MAITPQSTELQISESNTFSSLANSDSKTYRTQQRFNQDDLPFGVNLYARVRHNSNETGWSAWSSVVSFHVEIPAIIIGIAIDPSAAGGALEYIDMEGNQLEDPDILNHAAIKNITMSTQDSSRAAVTLTKYPKFYIKTAISGPAGTFAEGKHCLWISDMPFEGFRPHPAFKRSTSTGSDGKYIISDFVYIGTYCGHTESVTSSGTCLGSKKGATVATGSSSTTRSNLIQYCKNRNNSSYSQSGWRSYDIWDASLVRWTGLFLKKSFNFQSVYGTNSSSSPKAGATNCKIVYKGSTSSPSVWIDDVWSTYWQHVDCITFSSSRLVSLKSPMNQSSSLSIGGTTADKTLSSSSGYIKSFCSAPVVIGNDTHDILELFLPKTVVSSESSALVPDYHNNSTATSYMKIGGYWSNGSQGGIFSTQALADSYQESYQSYEVVDYEEETEKVIVGYNKTYWVSSRRCGYRCASWYEFSQSTRKGWKYQSASPSYQGIDMVIWGLSSEQRCNCPTKYGPFSSAGNIYINQYSYVAPCGTTNEYYLSSDALSWIRQSSCPKGWGTSHYNSSSGDYVRNAQGYLKAGETNYNSPIYEYRPTGDMIPVYGYVTRYRTVYYNYIGARIAKT